MLIHQTFRHTGRPQRWAVPAGVIGDEALFECWGAAGGLSSTYVAKGGNRTTRGGSGPRNDDYTNNPVRQGNLGETFANNAGYASGIKKVAVGEVYHINVGGNGGPGYSAVRVKANGTVVGTARGGAGGWNGGGTGGRGALCDRNYFNAPNTKVDFATSGVPNGPVKRGDLWNDHDNDVVRRAKRKYGAGQGQLSYWEVVTEHHRDAVGPSGGGGGGATDIRMNGDGLQHRILVAGGGGGSGGRFNKTGADAWTLKTNPVEPSPPFGSDTIATGATGPDKTWASRLNHLVGGWGGGGMGGGAGPVPGTQPTANGGRATVGGSGGGASGMHRSGDRPPKVKGSEGKGGGSNLGGRGGTGGGGNGSLLDGGSGATAPGRTDSPPNDWAAGGGGGGGGYYGGGGGGKGFVVGGSTQRRSQHNTHGGGGGGGSNYAGPQFLSSLLLSAARPPDAATREATGADGRGGFARIVYRMPPRVQFTQVPFTAAEGQPFDIEFRYAPAEAGGAPIDHYVVGTGPVDATFPTVQRTVMVEDHTRTAFTHSELVGPTAGTTQAVFVKAVDVDADSSAWIKHLVRGIPAPVPATITNPLDGDQFIDSAEVEWTLGDQSPLIAYRLGITGTDLVTGLHKDYPTPWKPGGSRVNLALDPGFMTNTYWSSTSNTDLAQTTANNGVSGSSGRIDWVLQDDGNAEQHTVRHSNLVPNMGYRLHLEVASATANDSRSVQIEVSDDSGSLAIEQVDFLTTGANVYVPVDIEFTPSKQGVVFSVIPSDDAGEFGNAEDGQTHFLRNMLVEVAYAEETLFHETFGAAESLDGWSDVNAEVAWVEAGRLEGDRGALQLTASAAGQVEIASAVSQPVKPGQTYTARAWSMADVTSRIGDLSLQFRDAANAIVAEVSATHTALLDTWSQAEVSGVAPANAVTATVNLEYDGAAIADVFFVDDISLSAEQYGAYFDGTNLNGQVGAVSWTGPVNNSPSLLDGPDVTSDVYTLVDTLLDSGALYLDTLNDDAIVLGSASVRAAIDIMVNPSIPATPTADLIVDHALGLMRLQINADDAAVPNKTVSFDVFRSLDDGETWTRIATGLTPTEVTRYVEFADTPAHGEEATYKVRAHDADGGWADQTDGTVTEVR